MHLHRFILPDANLGDKHLRIADKELCNQLRNVFRLSKGDVVVVSDGKGTQASAVITVLSGERAEIEVGEISVTLQPPRPVHLFCAVPKRENMELIVQKATELGVSAITPVITRYTVKQALRLDRLKKIALEAAEQCGRGEVPVINEIVLFGEALKKGEGYDKKIFCDMAGESKRPPTGKEGVAILVGPEGGWTDDERSQATHNGWISTTLNSFTLRVETAATVAAFWALYER